MKVKVLCYSCGTYFYEESDTEDILDQCPKCNSV